MDLKIEQEQPRKSETRRVGEKFHPFDPEEMSDIERRGHNGLATSVSLETEVPILPVLKIRIGTSPGRITRRDSVTPFNPDAGYIITGDDLNLESRLKKLNRPAYNENIYLDTAEAPIYLIIEQNFFNLNAQGLSDEHRIGIFRIKPEFLRLFKRLRVQVFIPGSPPEVDLDDPAYYPPSSWEALADPLSLRVGELRFHDYYPIDTGPLASDNPEKIDGRHKAPIGLIIFLPNDPAKLKQISVRFLLLPEKKNEALNTVDEDIDHGNKKEEKYTDQSGRQEIPKVFRDAFTDEQE